MERFYTFVFVAGIGCFAIAFLLSMVFPWMSLKSYHGMDYQTLEQLPVLRRVYALARRRTFDVHHLGGKALDYAIGALRAAHSGLLPTYLLWFLAGVLVLIYVLTRSMLP